MLMCNQSEGQQRNKTKDLAQTTLCRVDLCPIRLGEVDRVLVRLIFIKWLDMSLSRSFLLLFLIIKFKTKKNQLKLKNATLILIQQEELLFSMNLNRPTLASILNVNHLL